MNPIQLFFFAVGLVALSIGEAKASDETVLKNVSGFLPRETGQTGLKLGGSFDASMLNGIEAQAGKCRSKVHPFKAWATIYNCGDSEFSFRDTRLSFTVKHPASDHMQRNPGGTVIEMYSWIPCTETLQCRMLSKMIKLDHFKKDYEDGGSITYTYHGSSLKAEVVDSTSRPAGANRGAKFEWSSQ